MGDLEGERPARQTTIDPLAQHINQTITLGDGFSGDMLRQKLERDTPAQQARRDVQKLGDAAVPASETAVGVEDADALVDMLERGAVMRA